MLGIFNTIIGVVVNIFNNKTVQTLAIEVIGAAAQQKLEQNTSKLDDHAVQVVKEIVENNKLTVATKKKLAKTLTEENTVIPELKVDVTNKGDWVFQLKG